jgi:hypothetical protein
VKRKRSTLYGTWGGLTGVRMRVSNQAVSGLRISKEKSVRDSGCVELFEGPFQMCRRQRRTQRQASKRLFRASVPGGAEGRVVRLVFLLRMRTADSTAAAASRANKLPSGCSGDGMRLGIFLACGILSQSRGEGLTWSFASSRNSLI